MLRGLLALPLAAAMIAPGATALAAEATTGYSQTTPPPTTTTVTTTVTTTPPAKTETSPTPAQKVAPTQTSSTPAAKGEVKPTGTSGTSPTTTTPHATTLPFTGLDLRWVIVAGMLLLGTGASIMFVQRGRHGAGR
jgi:hypothetical protein